MSLRRGWLPGEDWWLVRASSVFEVECEVGIREVWTLLHEVEILAGQDVRNSEAYVHMAVDLIPCIGVHFLPDVGAGCSCRIANDGAA